MRIEELINPPQWLLEADTEGADVMLINDEVFWFDGIWKGGKWFGGVWLGGTFKGGSWFSGEFRNGVWENGVFWGGTWFEGEWKGGTWHRGLRFTFNSPDAEQTEGTSKTEDEQ